MISYCSAEWRKLNKGQLLFVAMIFLGLSSFIGLGTYFANREVFLQDTQTQVMWGQLTFYYSQIFFCPLIAIWSGQSLMIEFDRKTIEFLRVNGVSIHRLLLAKLVNLFILLIPVQLVLYVIFILGLQADQISFHHQFLEQLGWIGLSLMSSIPVLLAQLFWMAQTRSLSKAVSFAAMGSMGGFVILFINESLSPFYLYSLPMVALRSRVLTGMTLLELAIFMLTCLIYSFVAYCLTYRLLTRKT